MIQLKQIQLYDGSIRDIPQYCLDYIITEAKLNTRPNFKKKVQKMNQLLYVSQFSPLVYCQFEHWCAFHSKYAQFSRQLVNFKNNFLPAQPDQRDLLQLALIAELFCVISLKEFACQQLAKLIENMGVPEIKELFDQKQEIEDIEFDKYLNEIYIDEANVDYEREGSD